MIGIVILNYNNWEDTKKAIQSIFRTEEQYKYHIYVVDNASSIPPSQSFLSLIQKHKDVTLIKNPINKGYSAGNNIGIKKAIIDDCDEILVVNNDVIFYENSISRMKEYLNKNKNVGIVGPKVFLTDGSVQMINMVIKTGLKEKYYYLLRKTPFSFFVRPFLIKYSALDKDLSAPFEVHSVSGCCFMMSRKCSREMFPFDENTFLYQEELIIGIRMENLGYKTMYLTTSKVLHAHGQTTKSVRAFSYICLVESELYYFKKYIHSKTFLLVPLYTFRTIKYVLNCFRFQDFRKNIVQYFKRTTDSLLN